MVGIAKLLTFFENRDCAFPCITTVRKQHKLRANGFSLGCPRNEQKKIFGSNRNKICFAFVSVCFVKQKTKIFRFVSVFRTYIETTETNRTVS